MIYFLSSFLTAIAALVCAQVASNKSRSPLVWGVFGFVVPLIAVIAVCLVPRRTS